ncbi:MAG: hypothetical protein ACE5LU_12720 [Anaerolineae bacterium]
MKGTRPARFPQRPRSASSADFFGRCADYPKLADRLQDSVLVGPLNEDELRQVIERPASHVGLRLEPGLVETITREVADEPGALPLLSGLRSECSEARLRAGMTCHSLAEPARGRAFERQNWIRCASPLSHGI